MGALQPIHLIIILAIVLILFGGTKIPQLMRGIGQGVGELKKGMHGDQKAPDDAAQKEKDAAK